MTVLKDLCPFQVTLEKIGQLQVFKQEIQEFLFVDFEGEFIIAFTLITGLALAGPAFAATVRAANAVSLMKFLVARVDDAALPAGAVMENGFRQILAGNAYPLALLHVLDGAAADRIVDGIANVRTIAAQEALPVHGAFAFIVQATVNDVAHGLPPEAASRDTLDAATRGRLGRWLQALSPRFDSGAVITVKHRESLCRVVACYLKHAASPIAIAPFSPAGTTRIAALPASPCSPAIPCAAQSYCVCAGRPRCLWC